MDIIRIWFQGFNQRWATPQEVRVMSYAEIRVEQRGEWCVVSGRWLNEHFTPHVQFKAQFDRWKRIRGKRTLLGPVGKERMRDGVD